MLSSPLVLAFLCRPNPNIPGSSTDDDDVQSVSQGRYGALVRTSMHANHIIIVILHEYVLAQGGTGQELEGVPGQSASGDSLTVRATAGWSASSLDPNAFAYHCPHSLAGSTYT